MREFSSRSHRTLTDAPHAGDMSTIVNVIVGAALVMVTGGAVVAATVSDPTPPRVGDPVIVDGPQSVGTSSEPAADPAATPGSPGPADGGDDSDGRSDGSDDGAGNGAGRGPGGDGGTIDDDGVEEVFPSPKTLDDDDADDLGGDDGREADDTDDRGGD